MIFGLSILHTFEIIIIINSNPWTLSIRRKIPVHVSRKESTLQGVLKFSDISYQELACPESWLSWMVRFSEIQEFLEFWKFPQEIAIPFVPG